MPNFVLEHLKEPIISLREKTMTISYRINVNTLKDFEKLSLTL